jgi:large subunit ribosomal protein L7/L12
MASKSHEKMIEDIKNMTVLELSDLIKSIEETFGVSAAAPVAVAAAPAAVAGEAAQQEEKAEYKVTLKKAADKIKAIKALRQVLPSLNLSDAKKLVEEAPSVIVEAAPKKDALNIKKELEAVGAEVELA